MATDAIQFPNPVIRLGTIRRMNILLEEETDYRERTILESASGRSYEFGSQIKRSVFGKIIHGRAVTISEDGTARRSGQQVAIKVYSKRTLRALQGRTQENPLMEITAVQFIGDEHPNIMGQIDCCTDEDNIYSIMRYCDGGELFDYVSENGPMEEAQARDFFHQLMSALTHLQSLGVGHRDLSLENILYDSEGRFVVIDFGMCIRQQWDPATNTFRPVNRQSLSGRNNYISPEIWRREETFDPMLADIWSAGIILFILLTGVPAVDTASPADERYNMIAAGHLAEMLQAWEIHLSPEVVDLMQRLLRADPTERLTIAQVLNHPWMRDAPSSPPPHRDVSVLHGA